MCVCVCVCVCVWGGDIQAITMRRFWNGREREENYYIKGCIFFQSMQDKMFIKESPFIGYNWKKKKTGEQKKKKSKTIYIIIRRIIVLLLI